MNDNLILRIKVIIPEAANAKTYILENTGPEPVSYQAGQFLTFLISHHGHNIRRSYSMSSSPDAEPELAVTIKRVVNGEISRYLLDTLNVGDTIESLRPAGRFTVKAGFANLRDSILIAAGSGITPIFSLLKTILLREPHSRVTLIYANHTPQSAIFKAALDSWANLYPTQFRCIYIYSDANAADLGKNELAGRLNNAWLERLVTENLHFRRQDAVFYLCGPLAVMRMADITLRFMGFQSTQSRQEHFSITPVPTIEENVAHSGPPSQVTIRYRDQEFHLTVPVHKNILQVALDHGIQLPYSCRGGRCSTCLARCVSGKIRMSINDVLTDKEVAEGWVLTCTSYPKTEAVVLEIN